MEEWKSPLQKLRNEMVNNIKLVTTHVAKCACGLGWRGAVGVGGEVRVNII